MKISALISRYLMGLMFVVFGLNGLHPFIPQPPMEGPAAQFMAVVIPTHFMTPVFLVQLLGGLLLLANFYVPLALTLLGPVIFNIIVFHVTMQPSGLPPGIVVLVLWTIVFLSVRSAFAGILRR